MALNTVLDNLDDVPEALRAEYKEIDGKFVLDLRLRWRNMLSDFVLDRRFVGTTPECRGSV